MSTTMVEALGVSKVYCDGERKLEILKDVSFSLHEGEGAAILGPSGSGKTTLLNILSGLDRPSAGSVKLAGQELGALNDTQKAQLLNRDVGFVFQFYHLLPELTALENVLLPALMAGKVSRKEAEARANGLLERVGLKDRGKHFPDELSGGEQQRVSIARAMMNEPKILFCDEPTGNLDLKMGAQIIEILRDFFVKDKKTVVIVTHDERVAKIAGKVWNIVNQRWE